MNNTLENYFLLEKLSQSRLELFVPNTVILLIFLIVSIFGNVTVLYVYAIKIKTISDDRYFIPCLAVVDMAACIIGVTFALVLNFNPVYFRNNSACKVLWTTVMLCSICSSLMLLVVAVQRFLKVCRPFIGTLSIGKRRLIIVSVIGYAFVSALPCLYLYGESNHKIIYNHTLITGYTCDAVPNANKSVLFGYSIFLLIMCVLGITTVFVLYGAILKTIFKQQSFRRKYTSVNRANRTKIECDTGSKRIDRTDKERTSCLNSVRADDVPNSQGDSDCGESTVSQSVESTVKEKIGFRQRNRQNRLFRRIFRKHKISLMFFLITAVYVLSFLPRLILMIVEAVVEGFWDNLSEGEYLVCLCFYRLYLLNNVVNPIIYYFFDRHFRSGLKQCKVKKNDYQKSNDSTSKQ